MPDCARMPAAVSPKIGVSSFIGHPKGNETERNKVQHFLGLL